MGIENEYKSEYENENDIGIGNGSAGLAEYWSTARFRQAVLFHVCAVDPVCHVPVLLYGHNMLRVRMYVVPARG